MIPELHLADPTRCPSCSAPLTPERDACRACGLRLTGPLASQLWQVSVQAAELLDRRAALIAQLRREPAAAPRAPAGPPTAPTAPPVPPATPAVPRPEWSRRKVQNLLLALGVGLLGVAAVIFLAVSWGSLGVGGRSAVMAGVTALAAVGAVRTHRAGLTSTAEWLSLLTAGLAVLDCFGARSSDLAGLGDVDGPLYWAGALTVVAVLTGLLALVLPTRALPVTAAALGQLPVPLLAAYLADGADRPLAVDALLLTGQAVAALALAAAWPAGSRTHDARVLVAAGGGLALLVAAASAGAAAYAEDGSLVIGTALLLLLAGVLAAGAGWVAARHPADTGAVPALDGLAAVLLVAAVWAPAYDVVEPGWIGVAIAGLAAGLLLGGRWLPADRRTAPAVVVLLAGLLPALAAVEPVSRALDAMLRPLAEPWGWTPGSVHLVVDRPAAVLLAEAAALLVIGALVLRLRALAVAAVPVLGAAGLLAAPALGATYPVTLATLLGLAALLLVGGGLLDARGRVMPGWTALGTGAVLLALAASWALADDVTTLVTLPAVAVALLAGAVAARGPQEMRPWRVALVATSVLVVVAEAAALARYDGAGWPAVWSLALGLLAAVAAAAALALSLRTAPEDVFWGPLHTAVVAVGVAAMVADAAALARWGGTALAGCGLAAAVTAAALIAMTAAPVPTRRPVRGAAQVVAGLAAGPALALAALDGDRLWVALLATGIGLAVVATTPQRHQLGWGAGLVLAASSWVRLADADVDAPEAYTVPGGVALLVVGALRRRRDPAYGSWPAYGSGLSLVLVPSLLRAVTDSGDLRPLLLAVVAAAVLATGVARRLQAPLALGAAVLAIDALVQLAPYLAAAYDAVPRWVTIGALGLALLGAGATYEQRVRDLRRVGRRVAGLS
jgi:hypothetical protein